MHSVFDYSSGNKPLLLFNYSWPLWHINWNLTGAIQFYSILCKKLHFFALLFSSFSMQQIIITCNDVLFLEFKCTLNKFILNLNLCALFYAIFPFLLVSSPFNPYACFVLFLEWQLCHFSTEGLLKPKLSYHRNVRLRLVVYLPIF